MKSYMWRTNQANSTVTSVWSWRIQTKVKYYKSEFLILDLVLFRLVIYHFTLSKFFPWVTCIQYRQVVLPTRNSSVSYCDYFPKPVSDISRITWKVSKLWFVKKNGKKLVILNLRRIFWKIVGKFSKQCAYIRQSSSWNPGFCFSLDPHTR